MKGGAGGRERGVGRLGGGRRRGIGGGGGVFDRHELVFVDEAGGEKTEGVRVDDGFREDGKAGGGGEDGEGGVGRDGQGAGEGEQAFGAGGLGDGLEGLGGKGREGGGIQNERHRL